MATDATGATTSNGIPTFQTNTDAPSGKGFNAAMAVIDTLITTALKTVFKKAGATIGTRRGLNFIDGTDVSITVADNAGSDQADVTVALPGTLAANARLAIAKAGTTTGTRRKLNLIEGTGIAITEADDAVGEKVDVTIAAPFTSSAYVDKSTRSVGTTGIFCTQISGPTYAQLTAANGPKVLRVITQGQILNNTGASRTFTLQGGFGNTLFNDTTLNIPTATAPRAWVLTADYYVDTSSGLTLVGVSGRFSIGAPDSNLDFSPGVGAETLDFGTTDLLSATFLGGGYSPGAGTTPVFQINVSPSISSANLVMTGLGAIIVATA